MLETVDVGNQRIADYLPIVGRDAIEQLHVLAADLRGVRVLHLNATPYGGGVAEILRSEIPLLRDLGLIADWKIIAGDAAFFSVTKLIHNGLQGAAGALTPEQQAIYQENAERNARLLEEPYDLIVVHDPQPLALLHYHGKGASRWVWRCHIDTSEPNPAVWEYLKPYLAGYDAAVFTPGSFVPPTLPIERVEIIPPAIDPLSPKNMALGENVAQGVLRWVGVEIDKPLMTQVSRFDPWKDPLGVIAAYQLVRREIPALQLALAGSMALDDPEGWDIYHQVLGVAKADPGIHLFTNLTGVGNVEVNAFQRLSDVVVQKSIREGFGLVISEALWKGTPVVAGRAGGIPIQLRDGAGGFLVDTPESCAERVLWLLRHPREGQTIAERGREVVRERFLLTRLVADEMRLYRDLLGASRMNQPVALVGLRGEVRDLVCGMLVDPATEISTEYASHRYSFCSQPCRALFDAAPERFLLGAP